MTKDTRWPGVFFIIARSVQLLLAVIVMGIACYFATPNFIPIWYIGFSVAVSLMTIIYISTNFGLFFSNLLLPLPIVIIEPILFVLWAIVVAAIGIGNTDALNSSCVSDYDYTTLEACILLKAGFGVSTLELILLIPTLVVASIVMHKTRKDSRGKKHNQGRKGNRPAVAPPNYTQNPQQQQQQYPPQHQYYEQQYAQQQQYATQQQYQPVGQPQPTNPQLYQQSTPGFQSPVYPPQSTGSPGLYPQPSYTAPPPPPPPLSQGDLKAHEMPRYNQGGSH